MEEAMGMGYAKKKKYSQETPTCELCKSRRR
jgi:hypothetical protein